MEMVKVLFKLEPDETGYPPCNGESLWCIRVEDGLCVVDNIPFFVYGVALGDVIRTDSNGNFLSVERSSGNTTIRIYIEDVTLKHQLKKELMNIGCVWEQSHLKSLIAIGVPQDLKDEVISTLEYYKSDVFEYEIGN